MRLDIARVGGQRADRGRTAYGGPANVVLDGSAWVMVAGLGEDVGVVGAGTEWAAGAAGPTFGGLSGPSCKFGDVFTRRSEFGGRSTPSLILPHGGGDKRADLFH